MKVITHAHNNPSVKVINEELGKRLIAKIRSGEDKTLSDASKKLQKELVVESKKNLNS